MRSHAGVQCLAVALAALATPAHAQSLAARVAASGNGTLSFQFAGRPGLCGDGQSFIRLGRSYFGSYSSSARTDPCIAGPVQVRLTVHDGVVSRVETWVGPSRERDARALGLVSATEAARYLMNIVANADGVASEKAILPAVLADSATVWPTLLVVARDTQTRTHGTRQDAAFWLSRFAAGALAGQPNNPVAGDDDTDDRDGLKTHAVFVLSQLPDHGGVPMLLDVARTNPDRHVRSSALFWIGQSGDPRALSLFESLLRS